MRKRIEDEGGEEKRNTNVEPIIKDMRERTGNIREEKYIRDKSWMSERQVK